MRIKKGQKLQIKHNRSGKFKVIAEKNFDTETEEFYPVVLAKGQYVEGMASDWEEGDAIPCRRSLCTIQKTED